MPEPNTQLPLGQAPQIIPPPQATQKGLAPGAEIPVTPQEPTISMIGPDGSIADIPQSRAADAADKGGYKLGINMIGKDGSKAVIPSEQAHQAMVKGGYRTENPAQPTTERAMQQTMGGPPMFTDVPVGTKDAYEKAGQEGYTTGGEIGAGLMTAPAVIPVLEALAPHIPDIDKVLKISKALGYGAFGLKELHDIMNALKK